MNCQMEKAAAYIDIPIELFKAAGDGNRYTNGLEKISMSIYPYITYANVLKITHHVLIYCSGNRVKLSTTIGVRPLCLFFTQCYNSVV